MSTMKNSLNRKKTSFYDEVKQGDFFFLKQKNLTKFKYTCKNSTSKPRKKQTFSNKNNFRIKNKNNKSLVSLF